MMPWARNSHRHRPQAAVYSVPVQSGVPRLGDIGGGSGSQALRVRKRLTGSLPLPKSVPFQLCVILSHSVSIGASSRFA